jgi:hypothetical protein
VSVFRAELGGEVVYYLMSDDNRGPVRVIDHNGVVSERFTLPAEAYELVTRAVVYDEIADALHEVTLSKAARDVVENLLEGMAG